MLPGGSYACSAAATPCVDDKYLMSEISTNMYINTTDGISDRICDDSISEDYNNDQESSNNNSSSSSSTSKTHSPPSNYFNIETSCSFCDNCIDSGVVPTGLTTTKNTTTTPSTPTGGSIATPTTDFTTTPESTTTDFTIVESEEGVEEEDGYNSSSTDAADSVFLNINKNTGATSFRHTKLVLCSYYRQGYCKQGSRKCRFAHGQEEVEEAWNFKQKMDGGREKEDDCNRYPSYYKLMMGGGGGLVVEKRGRVVAEKKGRMENRGGMGAFTDSTGSIKGTTFNGYLKGEPLVQSTYGPHRTGGGLGINGNRSSNHSSTSCSIQERGRMEFCSNHSSSNGTSCRLDSGRNNKYRGNNPTYSKEGSCLPFDVVGFAPPPPPPPLGCCGHGSFVANNSGRASVNNYHLLPRGSFPPPPPPPRVFNMSSASGANNTYSINLAASSLPTSGGGVEVINAVTGSAKSFYRCSSPTHKNPPPPPPFPPPTWSPPPFAANSKNERSIPPPPVAGNVPNLHITPISTNNAQTGATMLTSNGCLYSTNHSSAKSFNTSNHNNGSSTCNQKHTTTTDVTTAGTRSLLPTSNLFNCPRPPPSRLATGSLPFAATGQCSHTTTTVSTTDNLNTTLTASGSDARSSTDAVFSPLHLSSLSFGSVPSPSRRRDKSDYDDGNIISTHRLFVNGETEKHKNDTSASLSLPSPSDFSSLPPQFSALLFYPPTNPPPWSPTSSSFGPPSIASSLTAETAVGSGSSSEKTERSTPMLHERGGSGEEEEKEEDQDEGKKRKKGRAEGAKGGRQEEFKGGEKEERGENNTISSSCTIHPDSLFNPPVRGTPPSDGLPPAPLLSFASKTSCITNNVTTTSSSTTMNTTSTSDTSGNTSCIVAVAAATARTTTTTANTTGASDDAASLSESNHTTGGEEEWVKDPYLQCFQTDKYVLDMRDRMILKDVDINRIFLNKLGSSNNVVCLDSRNTTVNISNTAKTQLTVRGRTSDSSADTSCSRKNIHDSKTISSNRTISKKSANEWKTHFQNVFGAALPYPSSFFCR